MRINSAELYTLGNKALFKLPKTAFFCSRDYPAAIERQTFLWAMEQRYRGHCILSGFHSRLEQAVLRYLLQGHWQPVIYALGRGIQPGTRFEYEADITAGRLLFVTPFEPGVQSVTQDTADIRNLLIADLADQFFIPYLSPGGNLERLLRIETIRAKPILTLDLPENQPLLALGAQLYRPGGVLGHAPRAAQP
ncbi:DNA-binding protein [Hymenobacter jeollabukensis]|uniref:DNA-binding protein n=1 Tax=Hymenobacter jeollabukensis TaxID=2025313 RepID=A0A5R8WSA6_9BACT|nr:DNA-binding protein [Hymenobacter jeollabukensis]TLM94060.1 DNA-binding protein [Hymenobacter jeollabukensis]